MMNLINRCPHSVIRGIYGDEIFFNGGYRLVCSHCGRLLRGPVELATWSQSDIDIEERKTKRMSANGRSKDIERRAKELIGLLNEYTDQTDLSAAVTEHRHSMPSMSESVRSTLIQALACLPWQYQQFVFDNDVDGVKTRWEDAWAWVERNGPHTEEMGN